MQLHHFGHVLRHRRDDGGGGGTGTDDHHAFAGMIEILGPLLRMDDGALERFLIREARPIAGFVVVVALAHEEEVAAEFDLALVCLRPHRPAGVGGGPGSAGDLMAEADVRLDAVLFHHLMQVLHDLGRGGDGLAVPRLELVAVGVEVAVRANAGEAEQVPGAADGRPPLHNDVALARTLLLQMARSPKSGKLRHR